MNLLPAIGGSCSANQLNDCYLINDHSTERRGGHLERKIWEGGGGEQYPNYKVNKKKNRAKYFLVRQILSHDLPRGGKWAILFFAQTSVFFWQLV